MVHTVIWLTILGVALLLPNLIAVRFALISDGGTAVAAGEAASVSSPVEVAPRARVGRPSPGMVRRGYLWKALSPLLFGILLILGMAISGIAGYALMGLGLLNMLWGFWGWDGYIAGKTR